MFNGATLYWLSRYFILYFFFAPNKKKDFWFEKVVENDHREEGIRVVLTVIYSISSALIPSR